MKKNEFNFERDGIIFKSLEITYDEVDRFIEENPEYRPIHYISADRIVIVSKDVEKHRTYKVFILCIMCGDEHVVKVFEDDYNKRFLRDCDDKLIQHRFPYLTREERDSIKLSYCPDCQKKLFCMNYPDLSPDIDMIDDDTEISNEPF